MRWMHNNKVENEMNPFVVATSCN